MDATQYLVQAILSKPGGSSLLSDATKKATKGPSPSMRAEFTVQQLQKPVLTKYKASPRSTILGDQLRRVEEQYKSELGLIDDVQEFLRGRAKLSTEYANGLQKLTQQFYSKRKWSPTNYVEGHDKILSTELFRILLNSSFEESKAHQNSSDLILNTIGASFENTKDDKRTLFKTAYSMLASLQEELQKLDIAVTQAKKEYDATMKELASIKKKAKKKTDSELKKAEQKAQFSRHQYLLELASANGYYLKYRNEQFPEIMDSIRKHDLEFLKKVHSNVAIYIGNIGQTLIEETNRVNKLSNLMDAEFEWRAFMHESRHEFPGRQLFDMEPYSPEEPRDITLDYETRPILLQIRRLYEVNSKSLQDELNDKDDKMDSLQSLFSHYTKAGDLFESKQIQTMREKMELLHADIEATAAKKAHFDLKIARITQTGIDQMPSPPPSPTVSSTVLDIDVAQAKEENRRSRFDKRVNSDANFSIEGSDSDSPKLSRQPSNVSDIGEQGVPHGIALGRGAPKVVTESKLAKTEAASVLNSSIPPPPPLPTSLSPIPPVAAPQMPTTVSQLPPPKIIAKPQPIVAAKPVLPTAAPPALPNIAPPPVPQAPPPLPTVAVPKLPVLPPPDLPPPALPPPVLPPSIDDEPDYHDEVPVHFRALYDYAGVQDDDLPLKQDEVILVLVERTDGWCQGINANGDVGFFPLSYVREIGDNEHVSMAYPRVVRIPNSGDIGFAVSGQCPTRVKQVVAGSAASKLGLRAGDVILEINTQPVAEADTQSILEIIQGLPPKEKINLCVITLPLGKHALADGTRRTSTASLV